MGSNSVQAQGFVLLLIAFVLLAAGLAHGGQHGLGRVFALVFRHPASVTLKMLEFYGMLARFSFPIRSVDRQR